MVFLLREHTGPNSRYSTSCTILSSSEVVWLYVPILQTMEEEYRAMMEEVKSELVEMMQKEKAEGMAIKEMVKDAEPVHEIVKTVEAENIDLLIMAAHNETRIEHIIYGRINHEIVRRLPCSVFLVKGE